MCLVGENAPLLGACCCEELAREQHSSTGLALAFRAQHIMEHKVQVLTVTLLESLLKMQAR